MLISRTTLPATLSSIFRSLIDYQDETVKAGTPGEGRAFRLRPAPPLEALPITLNRLEIQLTHAQDSRWLILVGLRQCAVVVVDVDAAAKHIVH